MIRRQLVVTVIGVEVEVLFECVQHIAHESLYCLAAVIDLESIVEVQEWV